MVVHDLAIVTVVPVDAAARLGELDDGYGAAHRDGVVDGGVVVVRVASVCCAQGWVDC